MDVFSVLFSLAEKGASHVGRLREMQREASRLNAEAGAEAGRCLDILDLATLRLKNKCQMIAPDNPEVWEGVSQALVAIHRDAQNAVDMYNKCQSAIETADVFKMPVVMSQMTTMHATSKRLVPWTQGVIDHYDSILDNAHRLPR